MARKPRKLVDSGFYHLILRGNDRQNLFYDDNDREFFIKRIKKYAAESHLELFAYCLMSNHVHFLIGNGNNNMSLFVKKITCSYVYRFNHKYERTGHLFQGRFKSEPIEDVEYFKTVYRYILHNPEKAKICEFQKYRWSSIFNETDQKYVNLEYISSVFGSDKLRKEFLNCQNDDVCMEDFTIPDNKAFNDELKLLFIKQLFNIENVLSIKNEPMDLQKSKLCLLKRCGLSINQISRLLEINRWIIKRA